MAVLDRSCSGKLQHTRSEALAAVEEIRRRGGRYHTGSGKHHMKAYECSECPPPRNWHIGHNAPPKRTNYKRLKRLNDYRIDGGVE